MKIFTLSRPRCRTLVNRKTARSNRAPPARPSLPAHTVKTCSNDHHIFSLGRMVAIPDNDDT
uniref:Uncharacterized protein n=1 Tax=Bradyrhizobium amphicarpaeae TaxID=1404768 RepID=A0A2U8PN30_9BRAD|nr:hypothetical protein CIT40_03325 [Bradyrhizobium amphicarpaeae]